MSDSLVPGARDFATTHWSLVLAARLDDAGQPQAREALEQLCRAYWYPLYAFVRYRGYASHEAQDLTQAFFTRVLETDGLASATPERGRFRSYLLGAMKHYLSNEWQRANAAKRGGGERFVELDGLEPEARHALEPATSSDPDASFDRAWALEAVQRVLKTLRTEAEADGKVERFEALKASLTGAEPRRGETAERLGLTPGAVKVAVHRLRQRYRELLRAEVAHTVADPADVDDELRHLVAALRQE